MPRPLKVVTYGTKSNFLDIDIFTCFFNLKFHLYDMNNMMNYSKQQRIRSNLKNFQCHALWKMWPTGLWPTGQKQTFWTWYFYRIFLPWIAFMAWPIWLTILNSKEFETSSKIFNAMPSESCDLRDRDLRDHFLAPYIFNSWINTQISFCLWPNSTTGR